VHLSLSGGSGTFVLYGGVCNGNVLYAAMYGARPVPLRARKEGIFTASGCLALNASFEPLTILPVRRALRLVIDRKAEILEVDDARTFRSARRDIPCPTVIRLVRYVHVPRKFRRQVTNTFLFARDGYRCLYCGRHRQELRGREFLTRDHVIPMSRGGLNVWANVVTACSPCNNRKGSRLPEEVLMFPLHPPHEPNYVELVWAVRRITVVQAKYIRMFYGADVLRALQNPMPVPAT
jgi:5-methylcytosine-specific restriction endonuclease McrA